MMFTLSTLLLAETVLAQDAPVSPPTQARILQKNNLAMELSGAIAGANLGELKKLGTEKSMTNLKNFVDDKILDKKLGMMEKRLEEGLEKKLEGALSATSAATGPSMEDEEKMIADQVIDQDIEQTFTDPKLASIAKAVEHEIANTVVDNLNRRMEKAKNGEEGSYEQENKMLVQEIVGNIMAKLKDAPEDKKAELEITLQKTFEEKLGKDIKDFSTKEGKRRALADSIGGTTVVALANGLPSPGPEIVATGVQVAETIANTDIPQQLANIVDNALGSNVGSTAVNFLLQFLRTR